MFSNRKTNCCNPKSNYSSNEPCIPSTSNPSVRRMSKAMKNPLRGHAMNNPEVLASVKIVDQAIRGPRFPRCSMNEQKKSMGHPLYQKWYMKTAQMENYPVHYNIPPVDYHTYLQQQNEQICSKLGPDFEKKCYMSTRDLNKIRRYEEYHNRTRVEKPSGICPNCKVKRNMKTMPHCCGCRCAYYQKLGWQNPNPDVKQGDKCNNELDEERGTGHLKCLTMKKSSLCQQSQQKEEKNFGRQKKKCLYPHDEWDNTEHDCDSLSEDYEPECPCGASHDGKGPLTEYQSSFQYQWNHSCSPTNSNHYDKKQPFPKPDYSRLKAWNYSMKPSDDKYEPTLAAAEAKLEALRRLLCEKPRQIPDYLNTDRRKFSKLRKENPSAVIRRSLLKNEWGETVDGDKDNLEVDDDEIKSDDEDHNNLDHNLETEEE